MTMPVNKNISNAELVLLLLINENEPVSGYTINKLIKERNYRDWVEIGKTSVYMSLRKIKRKKLVKSKIDKSKVGKGPAPTKFKITPLGKKVLTRTILESLSSSLERDIRFDIAFSGTAILPRVMVTIALEKRIESLAQRLSDFDFNYSQQDGDHLPLERKNLFNHSFFIIPQEIAYTKRLIDELNLR